MNPPSLQQARLSILWRMRRPPPCLHFHFSPTLRLLVITSRLWQTHSCLNQHPGICLLLQTPIGLVDCPAAAWASSTVTLVIARAALVTAWATLAVQMVQMALATLATLAFGRTVSGLLVRLQLAHRRLLPVIWCRRRPWLLLKLAITPMTCRGQVIPHRMRSLVCLPWLISTILPIDVALSTLSFCRVFK